MLAEILLKAREDKGKDWTIKKLSKKSKISASYIAELERGDKINPSADVLLSLAAPLGLSLNELITAREVDKKAVK